MTAQIESLESRKLFSATVSATVAADLARLAADGQVGKAHFLQYLPTLTAELAAVRRDLVGTGARNAILGAKLHADEVRCYVLLKATVTAFAATEGGVARRVIADGLRLLAHPTNPIFQARVALDAANFATVGNLLLTRLGTPAAACAAAAGADLAAISAANTSNPAIAADANAVQTDGGAFINTMRVDIQTIQSDLATLVNDIATGA